MAEKKTVSQVLQKYKSQQGLKNDSALAREMNVGRASIHQWMNGIHAPDVTWLRLHAIVHRGTWKGNMCTELLDVLGQPVEVR